MKANMRVSCHQLTIALLLGLFAFVATGSPTSAQIQGRVTEFFSEKPLADATVSIRGFRFEAHTDANGNYSIDYVPGSIELTAQKPGYVLLADRSLNLATVARAPIEDLVMIKALPGP